MLEQVTNIKPNKKIHNISIPVTLQEARLWESYLNRL